MPILAAYIVPHPPLIIPDIGRGEEIKISDTISAYQKIAKSIAQIKPDTIIISTPHSHSYYDYIQVSSGNKVKGSFNNFGSDLVIEASYNQDFIRELDSTLNEVDFPGGTKGNKNKDLDHGTLVPLYFINNVYQNYKIVRISLSGLSLKAHYDFGRIIQEVISKTDKRIVYIASGDLSHKLKEDGPYGLTEEGIEFDKKVINIIENNNLEKFTEFDESFLRKAAECGLKSFAMMAGVLSRYKVNSKLLSYEGPLGVGYAVASFIPTEMSDKSTLDSYVLLAKSTLENYILNKKIIDKPNDLPNDMVDKKAGVFVSLKKFGQLRGCIGTFGPTTNSIADEVIQNAISSGTRDPRFPSVKTAELRFLEYSVDVLSSPIIVKSIAELDPKKFGVIVSYKGRSGLLLPNLEGVNTVDYQLEIALRKAGILKTDDYQIEKFEVTRHTQ